jgi:putative protease
MSDEVKVGEVIKFFAQPSVAAVKALGPIKVGDELHFKGSTTDFTQGVESMQIDNAVVTEVGSGALVGIKVKDKVRPGDLVLKGS